jgi:hypothetical protein
VKINAAQKLSHVRSFDPSLSISINLWSDNWYQSREGCLARRWQTRRRGRTWRVGRRAHPSRCQCRRVAHLRRQSIVASIALRGTTDKKKGTHMERGMSGTSKPLSMSPRRTSAPLVGRREQSPSRRGRGEMVLRERVVRESTGSANYPNLTRSKYTELAMVMRV